MARSKRNLEEQVKIIGEETDVTGGARPASSYNSKKRSNPPKPNPPEEPKEETGDDDPDGDKGDKAKGNRTLISAWVDRDVWTEIRTLAQYRAAKGGVNHLGQPMSAGRLVEEALRLYLDQEENRKDLDKWYAFIKD